MSGLSFQEQVRWLINHSGLSLFLPSLIFIFFLFKWWFGTSNNKKNLPPSPPKLPIIGNLHQMGYLAHRSLHSLARKYGPLMLLKLGRQPVLVVTSADAAEEVLKTHDAAFSSRPDSSIARILLYDKDISFAPFGDYWRKVRGIAVLQLLNQKRVQSFRNVREEEVALMIERIRESCASSSVICMDKMLSTLTNGIMFRVAFGKRYSGEEDESRLKELLVEFTELLGASNIEDFIPWLSWINHFNGLEAKVSRVAKELDKCYENIIEEELNKQQRERNIGEGIESEYNQNLLQVLLEFQRTNSSTGDALDRDSVKAIMADMIGGGSDTYTLLEWAISELLRHTDVMEKLQNEVREVAGYKSSITEDDLEKLIYLKAIIKESIRLHPPAPFVPRASNKDVKLMGYDIAAGTQVLINSWAIARDPSLWEEPEEFKPERFLNSSIDLKGHDYQLLPFGSGRRSCPGYTFALVIAELALANLACNFNFALPGGSRIQDLDMTEAVGIVARRKSPLLLVASMH